MTRDCDSDIELIEEYIDNNEVRFDGPQGVQDLSKFCSRLGYNDITKKPIEEFLKDNQGAIEAIYDWIIDNMCEEWRDNIISYLPEQEDE